MAEDVGFALLDAARRMSLSRNISTSPSTNDDSHQLSSSVGSSSTGSGGWFDSWKSSTSELDDKTGSLPKDNSSWFNNFPPRNSNVIPDILVNNIQESCDSLHRAFSESEGNSRVKIGVIGGFFGQGNRGGWAPRKLSAEEGNGGRVRRASSKDVEEAMAGGLNKADIYMPPF